MSHSSEAPETGLNRRGLIAAVGGVAVAGVLPTAALAAASPGASPEFLAYRQHWLRYEELARASESAWDEQAYQQAADDTWEALRALLKRPMTGWKNVIELAKATRMELRGRDLTEAGTEGGPELMALLTGIETMAAMGGANV